MKTLIIVAHPNVEESATQQFLMASCSNLKQVTTYFLSDAPIDIKKEQQQLMAFDRILFQFPMYWYSAPYLLKKWLDDVFSYDFAQKELQNKELGLVVSLGIPEKNFNSGMPEKLTLSELFKPYEAIANKCHMVFLPIFSIAAFSYMTEKERRKLLIDYQYYVTGKNKLRFKDKQEWVIEHLDAYATKTQSTALQMILDIVEENQETLESLNALLEEMR